MAKVLIIDDDHDFAKTVELCLEPDKHQCFLAYSGMEGLHSYIENIPDAVILDLMLPDIDGLQVCDRIRQIALRNNALPPVIMILSAKADLQDRLKGFGMGALAYVKKPFDPDVLLVHLRSLLINCRPHITNEKV